MRKMLCLLLMLAMLTPCLPALSEDTDALDVILLSSASIEPLQETLRPGKAVTTCASASDGTAAAGTSAMSALCSAKFFAQREGGDNSSSARRLPSCSIP